MRTPAGVFGVVALVLTLPACADEPRASPLAPECTFSITIDSTPFGGGGGSSSASVRAPAGCAWAAASQVDWITIDAGASHSGDGTVSFSVAAYDGREARTGGLTIARQTVTVTQQPCEIRVQPERLEFADHPGRAELTVETLPGCRWAIETPVSWVSSEPSSGAGPARASVRVTENNHGEREAVLHVNSQPLTVRQSTEPCRFDLSFSPPSLPGAGGTTVLHIATMRSCAWRLDSAITRGISVSTQSGRGAAEVTVAVAANPQLDARSITFNVDGSTAQLVQHGGGQEGCTYRLDPLRPIQPMRGGSGEIGISTAPGCLWTVTSPEGHIVLASNATHAGPGVAKYDVLPNPGEFRIGRIEFRWAAPTAGENALVLQTGNCSTNFTRDGGGGWLDTLSFSAGGGSESIVVLVDGPSACQWRVESTPDWFTAVVHPSTARSMYSYELFTVPSDLRVTVSPNPSRSSRTATILVGEKPLTITQAGR